MQGALRSCSLQGTEVFTARQVLGAFFCPKSLWGAGLPSTLLQGRLYEVKREEGLGGEGCTFFAPLQPLCWDLAVSN